MIRKYCKEALSLAAAIMSLALLADAQAAKEARRFATGGEVTSFRYADASGIGYTAFVHMFTNTAAAAEFRNRSGKTLPVRLLVVGGGGAGMDGEKHSVVGSPRYGGGGGGGGGVLETNILLSAGDEWTIRVGAGGGITNHSYSIARGSAGASSVSNGVIELVLAPGGGAGGSRSFYATEGATGGGGAGTGDGYKSGANGIYQSFTFTVPEGVPVGPFNGGNSSGASTYGTAGGGGGASADGDGKKGGEGLVSDITGTDVTYGSGGGGGGMVRIYPARPANTGAVSGGNGGSGAGCSGECELKFEDDGATTNVYLTSATAPVPNRGGGGAGGSSFITSNFDCLYVDGDLTDTTTTKVFYATEGADGVVIIRYDIPDTPCVGGDVVTVTTNGYRVTYIHKFTNTTAAATFKPSVAFDGASVRLLAVGGGGAGMDGYTGTEYDQPGGGGGGGGGVLETNVLLSAGDEWTIRVGAGGRISNHAQGSQRLASGASSVSNGFEEVVSVPGGGAGGSNDHRPTSGAAGGGGAGGSSQSKRDGASGEYTSSTFISEGAANPTGGRGSAHGYGGGGGGAGANGTAAAGGVGLASDITGSEVVYGSGGGGGGAFRADQGKAIDGGSGGTNAGVGGTGIFSENIVDGNVVTNLTVTKATVPVANTGCGGAGGVTYGGSYNHDSIPSGDNYATAGADGVVIIRYEVNLPRHQGLLIVFQ